MWYMFMGHPGALHWVMHNATEEVCVEMKLKRQINEYQHQLQQQELRMEQQKLGAERELDENLKKYAQKNGGCMSKKWLNYKNQTLNFNAN